MRTVSCSCGQLSVACEGEPVRVSVCHCLACQKRTGSAFGAQARFPREKVSIEGTSTAYARFADSGNKATFHFCPTCGSTVYYWIGHDFIAVPIGAFADPLFPAPKFSVYETRQHGWIVIAADVEHFD
jgi:hypothetical protein